MSDGETSATSSTSEAKVSPMGIAAIVAALAAGGSGVGILSGGAEISREVADLRSQIAEIKDEQGAEELRMVALADDTDTAAAQRSRRVREDLEADVAALRETVHKLELQLAERR